MKKYIIMFILSMIVICYGKSKNYDSVFVACSDSIFYDANFRSNFQQFVTLINPEYNWSEIVTNYVTDEITGKITATNIVNQGQIITSNFWYHASARRYWSMGSYVDKTNTNITYNVLCESIPNVTDNKQKDIDQATKDLIHQTFQDLNEHLYVRFSFSPTEISNELNMKKRK